MAWCTIFQGAATNMFLMKGGIVERFEQGSELDTASVAGGRIMGFFAGDLFTMTGGSIGTFVDLDIGDNRIFISGGSIGNTVATGTGNDQFTWNTAGAIGGAIHLGGGNDTRTQQNLTDSVLSSTPLLNGGAGADSLTFANTTATSSARYVNWENVALTAGSEFTLDSNFVLGDTGTGSGGSVRFLPVTASTPR